MARVHDVGGNIGHGKIETASETKPFKAGWEARMWGINEAITGVSGWTIDWWRHVRELIPAGDYLTRPYFDQWMQVYSALLVDSGVASVGEIASGHSTGGKAGLGAPMSAGDVRAASAVTTDYGRPAANQPGHAVGDAVVMRTISGTGHTRLPAYLMGKRGHIHAWRGNHVFADENAKGNEVPQHLYTVAFAASDLWPEAAGRRETVLADLWESYFERG